MFDPTKAARLKRDTKNREGKDRWGRTGGEKALINRGAEGFNKNGAPVGAMRNRSIPGGTSPKVTPVMPVKRNVGSPARVGKPDGIKRAAADRFSKTIKKGAFKGLQKRF